MDVTRTIVRQKKAWLDFVNEALKKSYIQSIRKRRRCLARRMNVDKVKEVR